MGPTRFPYGVGKGFVNNFNYRGNTAGLIADGDTTPDVTLGDLFYTNNASATSIAYFDLQEYGTRAANYEGKVIKVFFLDNNTTIQNSGQVYLSSTASFLANQSIDLMQSRSAWYEITRSMVSQNVAGSMDVGGSMSVNFDGRNFVRFVGTGGAANTIVSVSGGNVAQSVWIINRSGGADVLISSAGNIFIAGTNAITLLTNNAYQLLKINSSQWALSRPNLFV